MWVNANGIERTWSMANATETSPNTRQAEGKQIFRDNIASLVEEFGGKKAFRDATGLSHQSLSYWLDEGVSTIKDEFKQSLKRIGIAEPDELFLLPLDMVRRQPSDPAVRSPVSAKASETEVRFHRLLNSPYKRPLQMAIDLMFNDLAENEEG